MPEKLIQSEFYQFFIKILLPAFLAVGLKIAIEMKSSKTKVTALNVFLSMIIGVGGAYICSDWVRSYFDADNVSIVIALIAITSDKRHTKILNHNLDCGRFRKNKSMGLKRFLTNGNYANLPTYVFCITF